MGFITQYIIITFTQDFCDKYMKLNIKFGLIMYFLGSHRFINVGLRYRFVRYYNNNNNNNTMNNLCVP